MINVDPLELEKFSQLAHRWWDPGAEFKPLHDINPLRLDYIDGIAGLRGLRVLDVGCGGGILDEAMAARGARVTGIDLAEKPLKVAQLHLLETGLEVEYRLIAPGTLAREPPDQVPDPAVAVRACSDLVRPAGHVFFSTINRNLKSYLLAVIGAEYVLKLLPRGTHDYASFIKPSELAGMCRGAGLQVSRVTGMTYNPLTKVYALGTDADVNYILHAIKP